MVKDTMNDYSLGTNKDRMILDLLYGLAAGEPVVEGATYERQLEYYKGVLGIEDKNILELLEYGKKYKLASKYMFPGKPENIKSRVFLIRLLAAHIVIDRIAKSKGYNQIIKSSFYEQIPNEITFEKEEDKITFTKEVMYLQKQYTSGLQEKDFEIFLEKFSKVEDDFSKVYGLVCNYILGQSSSEYFDEVIKFYNISKDKSVEFRLKLDAIAEIVTLKNEAFDYIEEFKKVWEKDFPNLKYSPKLEAYLKNRKKPYIMSYGNNISTIKNENYIFIMLADVAVKLALLENVNNRDELILKIIDITKNLGNNIRQVFIENRKSTMKLYRLDYNSEYSSKYRDALIPYKADLMYLKDIIIEEISFRNAGNIVHRGARTAKKISEYELIISEKDAKIFELEKELEYYENIKQQEFKAEISQYNKALSDLFKKMCDIKYNSPLNELYLILKKEDEIDNGRIKGLLQNLIYILSTMNIVPYDVSSIGKKVKFYDDEANMVYLVDENKVHEGLNIGTQVYPGWKYKETELVLPRVEIKEENDK